MWDDALSTYQTALAIYPGNNLILENQNTAQMQMPKLNSVQESQNTIQQITTNVVDTTVSTVKNVNERPSNVLEEIGVVFGTFSAMIFGFLN